MRVTSTLSKNALKVQTYLRKFDLDLVVKELPSSTRSAEDAAKSIDCSIENIVKSLVFKTEQSNQAILVLASGSNQVDLDKVGQLLQETLIRPDGKFVKKVTGYPIGGIPPVAHTTELRTFIDKDLISREGLLWAAAGMPNSVFSIKPDDLQKIIGNGTVLDLSQAEETEPARTLGLN